jgi:hypothetical protein
MALSAAPVVVRGGIQHNGVLCKACAPVKAPALRVRIRGLYVSRPSGKYRHTSQSQIPSPAVRGSKTGLVLRRPFAFCCMVVPVYVLSCCGRFAAYMGGAFPLTPPPPSGQVKQRHGRTRPHCHPLPWVNLHPRAPSTGLRPASPAGSRRDGQGEAMLIWSATRQALCPSPAAHPSAPSGSLFFAILVFCQKKLFVGVCPLKCEISCGGGWGVASFWRGKAHSRNCCEPD